MTQDEFGNDPAARFGLDVFQMVVDDNPVLIYAGRTEMDAERYTRFEGGRVVFCFQGDVLCSGDNEMHVCRATPEQRVVWAAGFYAAAATGTADQSDPASFACRPLVASR